MDTEPKSFGEFSASVLSALDTSAYVPASVFVGLAWMMFEIRNASGSVSLAVSNIAETNFGGAVVAIAAVFVVAAGIAPFQFFFIRCLEGYATPRLIAHPLEWLYSLHRRQLEAQLLWWEHRETHLERQINDLIDTENASQGTGDTPAGVESTEAEVDCPCNDPSCPLPRPHGTTSSGATDAAPRRIRGRARLGVAYIKYCAGHPQRPEIDRLRDELAYVSKKAERLGLRCNNLPQADRILPFPLGNRLRSYEDRLTDQLSGDSGETTIESFVLDVYHRLPTSLRFRHDRIKGQLEGYCTLVVVFMVLAAGPFFAFRSTDRSIAVAAALIVMACASYAAAVATAGAYGQVLTTIVDEPLPKETIVNPRIRRAFRATQSRVI